MRQQRRPAPPGRDDGFRDLMAGKRLSMLRMAVLLAAGDTHLAEDLVQATMIKVYLGWAAFQKVENPDGYLRRALVNTLIDERRRAWRRREQPAADLPDRAAAATSDPDGDAVRRALGELAPRMRAAVVLRYFHDLTVAETADALSCTEGTVKSQTARGLERLRAVLAPRPLGAKS